MSLITVCEPIRLVGLLTRLHLDAYISQTFVSNKKIKFKVFKKISTELKIRASFKYGSQPTYLAVMSLLKIPNTYVVDK